MSHQIFFVSPPRLRGVGRKNAAQSNQGDLERVLKPFPRWSGLCARRATPFCSPRGSLQIRKTSLIFHQKKMVLKEILKVFLRISTKKRWISWNFKHGFPICKHLRARQKVDYHRAQSSNHRGNCFITRHRSCWLDYYAFFTQLLLVSEEIQKTFGVLFIFCT